ncbi:tyrosine--tRNA ligase [Candidatus Saccharibacteria bacterium RIFCSPHIGHO2_01_FULL_45_15]|nr:MAG: tyrosine--tRNA ligase [Candidatus Saccharibacteria bacterium RIFCSPHIGHO2_01_FULL_45_15]OGL27985.1 MAG: tyrosine--tRNA ligase [Candidatus Saccharibacteria bacterium RIFCSPHIGHO2_02_FULL_46_12]OGL31708.1 MAG: tyrosine--tRNA ligase [Candidatus Saccharibacteria bacterium RIFCSPHIGHO2_12_FULL_44_22]
MTLSEELQWRGFYNQTTFDSPNALDEQQFTLYLGTDPSGDSLHVGHLAVYMMVRRFIDHGHAVVLLVGGGTGLIGDMRDTEERDLKPLDEIARNTLALKNQVETLFSGQSFELVDNYDWLKDVTIIPFLRDIGKLFTMNELTSREFYKARTGEGSTGLSYAEFTYTILQGYDYYHLHETKGVNLQIGGSDQWGNLLSGVELIRKKTGRTVHALSSPLVVNKSTGRKFGKSEGGAVWLDAARTSVYAFYQFWLNTDDESVVEYLKLFTLLSKQQIDEIIAEHTANQGLRIAQKALAREVTVLVHGDERTQGVINVTGVLFGASAFTDLSADDLSILAIEIPTVAMGVTISDALLAAGVVQSKGEVRRLIQNGGISVNSVKVNDDSIIGTVSLIKKGKNTFVLVK